MSDLSNLYTEISKRYDRLDVVFANAGMVEVVPFQASTEEHFDNTFNTNVRGLFFTVQRRPPVAGQRLDYPDLLRGQFRGSEGSTFTARQRRRSDRSRGAGPPIFGSAEFA